MSMYELDNKKPKVDPSAYIAPAAVVIGDVTIGKGASVWFNSVVRGDDNSIIIGEETNIQDLCILHVDDSHTLTIGNRVTVGHNCVVHGCTIEDECLIGMGAIILNGAHIGRGTIVAAGTVVKENAVIPPFSLVAGVPGEIKRTNSDSVLAQIQHSAAIYCSRAKSYRSDN